MFSRTLSGALKLLDRLTQGANIVGSLVILGLILLIGADVLGRNLAGAPVRGCLLYTSPSPRDS